MYNEERKRAFLNILKRDAILSDNIEDWFSRAEFFEKQKDKDMCRWNSFEFLEFFRYEYTSSIKLLVQMHNIMCRYVDWCIINGMVPDNQNHVREITVNNLCDCIDIQKLKEHIITRDKLIEEIDILPNYSDRFIFLGLFEGIKVANRDMENVKAGDLNGNELVLKSGTVLNISDKLKHYILMASEEATWITPGGKREWPYAMREEIIRNIDRKNVTDDMSLLITRRFRKCRSITDLSPDLNQKDIAESGRLNMIYEIMKRDNISFDTTVRKNRAKLQELYGPIQHVGIYIYIYGTLINQ